MRRTVTFSLGGLPVAVAGVAVLGLPPAMTAMPRRADVALLSDEALVVGGSGVPIPSQSYVDAVDDLYLAPHGFGDYTPHALFTPEGLYPFTGVKALPFDTSVTQGETILNNAIMDQVGPDAAAGNHLVVFGYSQSSVIASLEMRDLAALPADERPDPADLSFVLVGDESNPNGGMLARFPGLSVPSLGITFSGAGPSDAYPTDVYTMEYDGFADFPRYPLNLLSDLNALMGIAFVHGHYLDGVTAQQIDSAIELPTAGDTMTHYYMIPTQNLPLLDPLRAIPVVGNPLADLLQPDLRILVNVGYGDPDYGWSTGPADLETPFGLFPHVDPSEVFADLVTGAEHGISHAASDIESLQSNLPTDLSTLVGSLTGPHHLLSDISEAIATAAVTSPGAELTHIVNTLADVASADLSVLLPTADIGLAALSTIFGYDASLFMNGLQEALDGHLQGLLDAVGDPIAADLGLGTIAIGTELTVLAEAATTTVNDLAGLIS